MQVQAIFESAIQLTIEGHTIVPEIMIPLIVEKGELNLVKQFLVTTINQSFKKYAIQPFPYEIGMIIELLCACLIAV